MTEPELIQIEQRAHRLIDEMSAFRIDGTVESHVFECRCFRCAPAWDALRLVRLVRKLLKPAPLTMARGRGHRIVFSEDQDGHCTPVYPNAKRKRSA